VFQQKTSVPPRFMLCEKRVGGVKMVGWVGGETFFVVGLFGFFFKRQYSEKLVLVYK